MSALVAGALGLWQVQDDMPIFSKNMKLFAAGMFLLAISSAWVWFKPKSEVDTAASPWSPTTLDTEAIKPLGTDQIAKSVEHLPLEIERLELTKQSSQPELRAEPALDPQEAFGERDVDGSQTLSEAEYTIAFLAAEQGQRRPSEVVYSLDALRRAKAKFDRDDEDRDGQLSEAEFSAGKFRIEAPGG